MIRLIQRIGTRHPILLKVSRQLALGLLVTEKPLVLLHKILDILVRPRRILSHQLHLPDRMIKVRLIQCHVEFPIHQVVLARSLEPAQHPKSKIVFGLIATGEVLADHVANLYRVVAFREGGTREGALDALLGLPFVVAFSDPEAFGGEFAEPVVVHVFEAANAEELELAEGWSALVGPEFAETREAEDELLLYFEECHGWQGGTTL